MAYSRTGSFKAALSDNDSTAQEMLGTVRDDLNGSYKYVKFSGTAAVAIGDFVCYVVTDTTLQTVDATNSALPAGVAQCVAASGAVSYGWVQTKGVATLSTALGGSPSQGNSLTNVGASNKALTKSANVTDPLVGVAVDVANKIVQLNLGA